MASIALRRCLSLLAGTTLGLLWGADRLEETRPQQKDKFLSFEGEWNTGVVLLCLPCLFLIEPIAVVSMGGADLGTT